MKKGALKGLEVALKKATEEICGLEAEILAEGRIRRRVEGLVAHLEETVDLAKEDADG